MKFLSKIILAILGWKIKGQFPTQYKRMIIIGAPHTSNWDLFYGLVWAAFMKIRIKFLIKKEIMYFPLNIILKLFGAIPISRKGNQKTVDVIAEYISSKSKIYLAISPEGTRKKTHQWKTGFYYIAQKANIPILPVYINYKKKEIGTFDIINPPLNNLEKDISELQAKYSNIERYK